MKVEGWSAGLEAWTEAHLSLQERMQLVHVHDKQIGNQLFALFKDPLNRWFRARLGQG